MGPAGHVPGARKARQMASKSGKTTVKTEKFVKIAEKLGLPVVAKKGWLLVGEPRGPRLLVHTGKRGTNCIELVSFESTYARAHPCPPAKTMTQLIDFDVDSETLILNNTFKTAKVLADILSARAAQGEEAKAEQAPEAPAAEPETAEAEPVAAEG